MKDIHSIFKNSEDHSQHMITALREEMSSVVTNMASVVQDLTDGVRNASPSPPKNLASDIDNDLFQVHHWIKAYVAQQMVDGMKGLNSFQ